MSRRCEICGKTSSAGNSITRSGSPKYKGGIGLHTGGITKRRFYPNIQKIRIVVDGTVKRTRVCTRCLKAKKVKRPPARPAKLIAAAQAEERRLRAEEEEAARAAAEGAAAEAEARAEAEEAEDVEAAEDAESTGAATGEDVKA